MPKIHWPDELPLYDRCTLVRWVSRKEYGPFVYCGAWHGVGTRVRMAALHVVHKDGRDLKADKVPTGQRMVFNEPVGDYKVWQHRRTALAWHTIPEAKQGPTYRRASATGRRRAVSGS